MPDDQALVVSMFQSVEAQLKRVIDRVDDLSKSVELVSDQGADLNAKVAIQNGGVKKALDKIAHLDEWQRKHDSDAVVIAATAAGRKAQRADDYAKVKRVQSFASDWWPLLAGSVLGAAGLASLVIGRFG